MRIFNRALVIAALGAVAILGACTNEGAVEKAGKEIDNAVEQTADKIKETTNDLIGKEGAAETAGKNIDNAIEKTGEKIDQVAEKTGDKMNEIGEAVKDKASN